MPIPADAIPLGALPPDAIPLTPIPSASVAPAQATPTENNFPSPTATAKVIPPDAIALPPASPVALETFGAVGRANPLQTSTNLTPEQVSAGNPLATGEVQRAPFQPADVVAGGVVGAAQGGVRAAARTAVEYGLQAPTADIFDQILPDAPAGPIDPMTGQPDRSYEALRYAAVQLGSLAPIVAGHLAFPPKAAPKIPPAEPQARPVEVSQPRPGEVQPQSVAAPPVAPAQSRVADILTRKEMPSVDDVAAERLGPAQSSRPTIRPNNRPLMPGDVVAERRVGDPPPPPPLAERLVRIREALKAAKPVRAAQEAGYTAERGKRLKDLLGARESTSGEASLRAELSTMKGELPKVQFESLRPKIGQQDIDWLFDDITRSDLGPWEKLRAKVGLGKLFGEAGGQVPQENELELLKRVFGPEIGEIARTKRTMGEKAWRAFLEVAGAAKTMMASPDLSGALRQAVFLVGRPVRLGQAFGSSVRQAFSEEAYKAAGYELRARPNYELMTTSVRKGGAGLTLTDIGGELSEREEKFISSLPEKIPGYGRLVRGSNRAMVGLLNRLRADVFEDIWGKVPEERQAANLASLGRYINNATGRGGLGPLEPAAVALNVALFSPRLFASRIQLLNPLFYAGLEREVRREALKDLFKFASVGMTIVGLAKLNGADVVTDWRNTDFMKIKVGNTRYDIWGSFQQPLVALARILTGQMVSSTTGREYDLGEGYKPTTRKDIAQHFIEAKEAPVASLVNLLMEGQGPRGQPLDVPAEVLERVLPMVAGDLFDIAREHGADKLWMGTPAVLGTGVQTYGKEIPMEDTTPSGRPKVTFRQPPSLAETLMNKARGHEVTTIPKEQHAPLERARRAELSQKADIEKARKLTLDDGQTRQVGDTEVFLDRGIVKTRKLERTRRGGPERGTVAEMLSRPSAQE